MGLPVTEVLEQAMVRAVSEGADADLVEKMRGGKTGVVGVMKFSRLVNSSFSFRSWTVMMSKSVILLITGL